MLIFKAEKSFLSTALLNYSEVLVFPVQSWEKALNKVQISKVLPLNTPCGVQQLLWDPSIPTGELRKQKPCLNKDNLGKAHHSSQRFLSRQRGHRKARRQEWGAKEQETHFCGNKQEKEPMVRDACECRGCLISAQGNTPGMVISSQALSRAGLAAFSPFLNPHSQCEQEKSSTSACKFTTHITEFGMPHACVNPNSTYVLIFL